MSRRTTMSPKAFLPPPRHSSPFYVARTRSASPLIALLFLSPFLLCSLLTSVLRATLLPSPLHQQGDHTPWIHPSAHLHPRRAPPLDAVGLVLPSLQNSNRTIFDPSDLNNPTKVPVPPNGFPPPHLPLSDPLHAHLSRIRARCKLSPRWPKHPAMHAVELRTYGPAYSSIVVSEALKVIYVPVFKVGTTSMMWHIAYLEDNHHILRLNSSGPNVGETDLHDMGGPAWREHAIWRMSDEQIRAYFEDPRYLKFGFVRNPFDRIISAYIDKVVSQPIESIEYQLQMYGLYGKDQALRTVRNSTKPTFRQYLEAIGNVLSEPRTKNPDLWSSDSFEDNRSRRDLHWRPQVELLHPDLVHFDYVGRFERLEQDRGVILNWMYKHTDRRMPQTYQKKMHATDPNEKTEIYNDLRRDVSLRNLVLEIYDVDFERFQFSRKVPRKRPVS